VTHLTERRADPIFNDGVGEEQTTNRGSPMLSAIIIAVVIVAALANAFRPGRSDIITSRPYNNRYNAASGAREDSLPAE
jgi:hypothetical protein